MFNKIELPPVTHVIFDCDGTLVNSIERGIDVVDGIIRRTNPALAINDRIRDFIPNLPSLRALVELINSELSLSLDPLETSQLISDEARKDVVLLPGVHRLLRHLKAHHIPMAVCTGGSLAQYQYCVSHLPMSFTSENYFSHIVAGDDPELTPDTRKPHPRPFTLAAQRFNPPPKDGMNGVLLFEDSILGLRSAVESGGRTVFVSKWRSMFTAENRPLIDRAALVLDTLEHFKPEAFGLPPYDSEEAEEDEEDEKNKGN